MSILSSLFAPSPPPGWGIYRRNIYLKHFLTSLLHPLPIPSDQSSCVSLAGEHKHSHFVIPWPNPVSESLSRLTGVQRQEAGSSQSTTPPTSFWCLRTLIYIHIWVPHSCAYTASFSWMGRWRRHPPLRVLMREPQPSNVGGHHAQSLALV